MNQNIPVTHRSTSDGCQRSKILRLDLFAREFNFKLPNHRRENPTISGCLLTCLLILAVISYGTMQSIQLFNFDETDIMESSRDAYFDSDFVYGSPDLAFAYGLTAYDSN